MQDKGQERLQFHLLLVSPEETGRHEEKTGCLLVSTPPPQSGNLQEAHLASWQLLPVLPEPRTAPRTIQAAATGEVRAARPTLGALSLSWGVQNGALAARK